MPSRRVTRLLLVGSLLAVAGVVLLPTVYLSNHDLARTAVAIDDNGDRVHLDARPAPRATVLHDASTTAVVAAVQRRQRERARRRREETDPPEADDLAVTSAASATEVATEDPLRAATFAQDWLRLYRVAVLPERERGISANFYNWRRTIPLSNITAADCAAPQQQAAAAPFGAEFSVSPHVYGIVRLWGPCVRFNATAVRFTKPAGSAELEPAPPGYAPRMDGYPIFGPGWLTNEGNFTKTPECTYERVRSGLLVPSVHLGGYLRDAASNVAVVPDAMCPPLLAPSSSTPPHTEPLALLVLRTYYGSLYHTLIDWFDTVDALEYTVAESGGRHPAGPVQVVFLDAHPPGPYDATWATLFGRAPVRLSDASVRDMRMRTAVLVSAWSESPILTSRSGGALADLRSGSIQRFAELLLLRHGFVLSQERRAFRVGHRAAVRHCAVPPAPSESGTGLAGAVQDGPPWPRWITVIFRKDYPDQPGMRTRLIANEVEVVRALERALAAGRSPPPGGAWGVRAVYMEDMTVREQLAVLRSSMIVVAVNGEALSLAIVMRYGTLVVELQPAEYAHDLYKHIILAAGVQYVPYPLHTAAGDGPYTIDALVLATAVAEHVPQLLFP